MDANTWARAKDLIAEALALPESERDAYLRTHCPDPVLLDHVKALLVEYDERFLVDVATAKHLFDRPVGRVISEELLTGVAVGPYTILERLGVGGMGQVYLATDPRLKRRVALKCLLSSTHGRDDLREQILEEARAAARISHQNVATIYDVIEHGDRAFIVMEYVEGESLASCIARGPLPIDRVIATGRELAAALSAAHAQHIVHRDLKPGNVQLTRAGSAKVLDFGIAQAFSKAAISSVSVPATVQTLDLGRAVGTPAYMSPEQVLGLSVDERSDVYSLGVVLFEMTVGKRPYAAKDPFELVTAFREPRPRADQDRPDVPRALGDVIATALKTDRDARYQTAEEMGRALAAVEAALKGRSPARRVRQLVGAAALAITITAAGLFTALRGPSQPAAPGSQPVIAVLPLENLSGDASKQYLGLGVADTLAMALSKVRQLTVISRAETQAALREADDPKKVARVLGASFLVGGSVQQAGDRLRVVVRIVRPDGGVEWSEAYDDSTAAIFQLQQTMAAALARELQAKTGGGSRPDLTLPSTLSPDALTKYWQGRALLETAASVPQIEGAVAAFQQALTFDANYALGYAGLADAYWKHYLESHDDASARRALEAGLKALSLDPDQPAVRVAVGTIYEGMGQPDQAIGELRRALDLQPNNADARRILARVFSSRAGWDAAIQELQEAIAIQPGNVSNYIELGRLYQRLRRLPEAIAAFQRALEIDPNDSRLYNNLGGVYAAIPDDERALENFTRANQIQPQRRTLSNIGTMNYRLGRFRDAVTAYKAALAIDPKSDVTHGNLGDAYVRLGQKVEAENEYRTARELGLNALRVNARDAQTLARVAVFEAKLGLGDQATARIRQAQAIAHDDPEIQFKGAVVEAQLGRRDQALQQLTRALDLGYSARVAADDYDLVSLRSSDTFQQLMRR